MMIDTAMNAPANVTMTKACGAIFSGHEKGAR